MTGLAHPGYGLRPGGTPARGHVLVLALGPGVWLLRGRPRCTTPWLPAQRSSAIADRCCNWLGNARAIALSWSHPMGHYRTYEHGHYKDIIRTTQGACLAPAGRILGSPSMGDPGGALRIRWGVFRVAHTWARTVDGSRVYGWDHCEVQGEMPCLPHTAWPLGDQPKRVLLDLTLYSALPGRARRHENWYGY